VSGGKNGTSFVLRVTPQGTVDTTFGPSGAGVDWGSGAIQTPIAVAMDGDTFVSTQTQGTAQANQAVSIAPDGTVKALFPDTYYAYSVAQHGARFYVGAGGALAAYTLAGAVDTTFGTNGILYFPIDTTRSAEVQQIMPASDGSLYVLSTLGLDHYRPDGSFDAAFGTQGRVSDAAAADFFVQRCDGAFMSWGGADGSSFTVISSDAAGKNVRSDRGAAQNVLSVHRTAVFDPNTGDVYVLEGTTLATQIKVARYLP
jgi:hypothetical protein